MRLEKIKSKELKRQIALRIGKLNFEDVTEEDFDEISELTLNFKSINGKKTDINLNVLEFFPYLKKIRIIDFDINQEDICKINKLECVEVLEFSRCKFNKINFDVIEERLKKIDFSECGELAFKYPKVKNILINMCEIDFEFVDLEAVQKIYVFDSVIKNLPDLSKYKDLEKVIFDGSKIIDANGKEIEDALISEHTEYSHKANVEKIDRKKELKNTDLKDDKYNKDDNKNSLIL